MIHERPDLSKFDGGFVVNKGEKYEKSYICNLYVVYGCGVCGE